jgi:hypothetical protein
MNELLIREVQAGDVEALLANLRPADRAEAEALVGAEKTEDAIRACLSQAVMSWTGHVGEKVAFIFGCSPATLLGEEGVPWLVGTPLIDCHRRAFIRFSHQYIPSMLAIFPTLVNLVDARNVKSIAWLKKMGFTLLPPQPAGVAGLPFIPFFMESM